VDRRFSQEEHPRLFRTYIPASPLDQFIENFWLYRGYASPHPKERILQDGTFKAVFNLEQDEFRIYDPWQASELERYSGAIVSRPSAIPFVTDSEEEAHVLGVNFRIGGALPFLGRTASDAGGTHVELAELWGQQANDLRNRLADAQEPNERFRLLESALLRRLSRGELHHPATQAALHSLGTPGRASRTREIARQVGLSQRRLITVFKHEIGVTPQLFGRVRRFQRALSLIRRNGAPDWPTLALDCGYCDQSHMIRDFDAFAGLSPAAYVRGQRALAHQGFRIKHNHIPLIE
jgi:AraC-like DNA-binding protein